MCFGAPNPGGKGPGKLYDIGRYVDLFSKPRAQGGLKVDPADVLLVGIDAPEKPFEIILADPSSGNDGKPFEECARLNENTSPLCMPELQHSCQSTQNGAFFGDPASRQMLQDMYGDIRMLCYEVDLMNPAARLMWRACRIGGRPSRYRGEPSRHLADAT